MKIFLFFSIDERASERERESGTLLFALFDCVIESKLLPVDLSQYTNLDTTVDLFAFFLCSSEYTRVRFFETLSKSHLINGRIVGKKMVKHKKATKKVFSVIISVYLWPIDTMHVAHTHGYLYVMMIEDVLPCNGEEQEMEGRRGDTERKKQRQFNRILPNNANYNQIGTN